MREYRDLIWHVCKDYSLNAAWEVEDAFQEVLCVLWRDLDSFKGWSSTKTWVYRVATNTMLMIKRKHSNKPTDALVIDKEEAAPDMENFHLLMQLIDNLGEKDSQIVHAHLDGFKYDEIADMTGMTPASVAMRISRAKKKLREQYNRTT